MVQEMQIPITLLYLRQQIQLGVFDGALQTTEELIFNIRNEQKRMTELIEQITKDVLQITREQEFEKMLTRYEERRKQEDKQFREIKQLITYTIQEYNDQELTSKWSIIV